MHDIYYKLSDIEHMLYEYEPKHRGDIRILHEKLIELHDIAAKKILEAE